jgi:AhpC/TSA family/Disulphide bond corrector protein DsbC
VELQGRHAEIQKQGLGLVAISYDPVETLKTFSDSRGITFPLISDPGSAIIKRYGLFNESIEPGNRAYGVPHPGTLVVDRNGVVTARFFEEEYQERNTAGSVLTRLGISAPAVTVSGRTPHLTLAASITDAVVAPGERLTMVLDIRPGRGIHVYAPGTHTYQVVRLVLDPQPWLRVQPTQYPPSAIYHFKPLDERVEVFTEPFRLLTDVTILATPDVAKLLAGRDSLTISGALEYQACDNRVCFNPSRVPVTFTLKLKPLDRRPPGG